MCLTASSVVPLRSGKCYKWQVVSVGFFQKGAGRTCLGQPYTLIQNKVKRTVRTLCRVKEVQHECPLWVVFCLSQLYYLTGRF
jgi:hypothetical protein